MKCTAAPARPPSSHAKDRMRSARASGGARARTASMSTRCMDGRLPACVSMRVCVRVCGMTADT
eukprot:1152426-Pelagomonas_calceolata.AAC.4